MEITLQQINSVPEGYRTAVYMSWFLQCKKDFLYILEKVKPFGMARAELSGISAGLGLKSESSEDISSFTINLALSELATRYPLSFVDCIKAEMSK